MASSLLNVLVFLLLFLCACTSCTNASSPISTDAYVVHVRSPPEDFNGTRRDWHVAFLPDPSRLLHSFNHALSGFTAMLTQGELDSMRNLYGFIHATPTVTHDLHTTHTPSFLGLNTNPSGFWAQSARYGEGLIIGVLDTGITPTHPSFRDDDMPTPPSKWKGKCNFKDTSLCNNKLIGARTFIGGKESSLEPLDEDGHGTHTASTAAGRFVANASILESAMGTAVGMAPYAHLAAYKVCWENGCNLIDTMVAIDMAIEDGVDVISISIGGPAVPLYEDPKAIANFAAVKLGVFVAISAGNSGPEPSTVDNISPWVLTVGASTIDRRIRAVVFLGNGMELEGESAYQPFDFPNHNLPIVYPRLEGDANSIACSNVTSLRRFGVEGKVVLCQDYTVNEVEKGKLVKEAGGVGMIIWGRKRRGYDTYAKANVIPTSHITYADGLTIQAYIESTVNPTVAIGFQGTKIGGYSDPAVAAFSSRGPSKVNNGIMKPDIIGPGVNILAAWPQPVGPFPIDPPFNMISGTSMSCPHLAGVAALLKRSHPDWSPAMIKSAIMTSSDKVNLGGGAILDQSNLTKAGFYEMGAGHVNPTRANQPGLVYDIQTPDYISYLCGLYNDSSVQVIASDPSISCANYGSIAETDLNYPSVKAFLSSSANYVTKVGRTLTNVGDAPTYTAYIVRPYGITMDVQPTMLEFTAVGEKQKFSVTFGLNSTEPVNTRRPWYSEGYLLWISADQTITVKSPISVEVI